MAHPATFSRWPSPAGQGGRASGRDGDPCSTDNSSMLMLVWPESFASIRAHAGQHCVRFGERQIWRIVAIAERLGAVPCAGVERSATPFVASPRLWRSGQGALHFPRREMPPAADTAPVWALSLVVPLGRCLVKECLLIGADPFSSFAARLPCLVLVLVCHFGLTLAFQANHDADTRRENTRT